MDPKPVHLGPTYGAQFADESVVGAYRHRAPYPAETFTLLTALLPTAGRAAGSAAGSATGGRVLEVGSGTGDLTRPLAAFVDEIDAVEPSASMRAAARQLPGGESVRIQWIAADAETAPLRAAYDLAVAAESLHWTDWPIVLPRIGRALAPGAMLALVGRQREERPWWGGLNDLIPRYSTNRDYAPYDLVHELTQRDLFRERGRAETAFVSFEQTVEAYIESFHSRNGFSRERMAPTAASGFDSELRALVMPHAQDGVLRQAVSALVVWGSIPIVPEAG